MNTRKYLTEKLKVESDAIDYMEYDYDVNTLLVKFNYGRNKRHLCGGCFYTK